LLLDKEKIQIEVKNKFYNKFDFEFEK